MVRTPTKLPARVSTNAPARPANHARYIDKKMPRRARFVTRIIKREVINGCDVSPGFSDEYVFAYLAEMEQLAHTCI